MEDMYNNNGNNYGNNNISLTVSSEVCTMRTIICLPSRRAADLQ